MNNSLICVSKKTIYFISLFLLFVFVFVLVGLINKKKLPFKTEANVYGFSCSKFGKYEVQDRALLNEWVNDCKLKYGQTTAWNGSYGTNAKCYTQTAICANLIDCVKHDCLTDCLYEEVSISICQQHGTAPTNVITREIRCPSDGVKKYGWGYKNNCYSISGEIRYYPNGEPYCANGIVADNLCCTVGSTNPKCPTPTPTMTPIPTPFITSAVSPRNIPPTVSPCAGQKCYGNVSIGDCAPGYLKRCQCARNSAGYLIAKYVNDNYCSQSITAPIAQCNYGGKPITTTTTPYRYLISDNFCIYDQLNHRVGARCQSSSGVLINGNAKIDSINCPKPTIGACLLNESKWKTDKNTCQYGKNKYLLYGSCLPGNYRCQCDTKAKYNYPTLQVDPSCGT